MDMDKNREIQTMIFKPGQTPDSSFVLWWALRLLKIPGMATLAKRIILRYLPDCVNISMQSGFKVLYGNVTAKNVSFSDTFLQDYADIVIGEGTGFSYQCMILTAGHDYEKDFGTIVAKPVVIGKNVWITTRVIILGGVKIGDNSVIGAGSVVSNDIPENVLAAGVPAKPIRHLER